MAKTSIRQYDPVAANNTDINSVPLGVTTKPSDAIKFEQANMANLAQWAAEMSFPAAGGSANALTLTPTTALAALASNQVYTLEVTTANTGAATLAVSGLTPKAIRRIVAGVDVDVAAGELQVGQRVMVVYDATANGAAGAWMMTSTPYADTKLPLVGGTLTGDLLFAAGKGATTGIFFHVDKNGTNQGSLSAATNNKITFTHAVANVGSAWSTSTSKFTAPRAGTYIFVLSLDFTGATSGSEYDPSLYKNGAGITTTLSMATTLTHTTRQIISILQLAAGDTIEPYAYSTTGGSTAIYGAVNVTYFMGAAL